MTPNQFVNAGVWLFGKRWKVKMSRVLGRDPSMIWRYATGQAPIPELVAFYVSTLVKESRQGKSGRSKWKS